MLSNFTFPIRYLNTDKVDLLNTFSNYPLDSFEYEVMIKIVKIIDDILLAKKLKERSIEKKLSPIYFKYRYKIVTVNNVLKFRMIYSAKADCLDFSMERRNDARKVLIQSDAILMIKSEKLYHLETNARVLFCNAIRNYNSHYFIHHNMIN